MSQIRFILTRPVAAALFIFVIASLVGGAPRSFARSVDHREENSMEEWVEGNFEGLPYRVLFPKNYQPALKYPLVLFLHGSAESGNDNRSQISNGVELFAKRSYRNKFPAIVIAPQSPTDDSWGGLFYGGQTETQKKVIALIDQISQLYPVDSSRRYLTGVSMGAIGAWDMVWRYPNTFAALLPIAGAADPSSAQALTQLPIWAFHGSDDDAVDPHEVREIFSFMKNNRGRMLYTEYPGIGHDSWSQTYRDPSVIDWLFQQTL